MTLGSSITRHKSCRLRGPFPGEFRHLTPSPNSEGKEVHWLLRAEHFLDFFFQ